MLSLFVLLEYKKKNDCGDGNILSSLFFVNKLLE